MYILYSKVSDSSKKFWIMANSVESATQIGHFKIVTFSRLSGISKREEDSLASSFLIEYDNKFDFTSK